MSLHDNVIDHALWSTVWLQPTGHSGEYNMIIFMVFLLVLHVNLTFAIAFAFLHELHLQLPISKNNRSNFLMHWLSLAGSLLFWTCLFEQHAGIQSTQWRIQTFR